jgi:tetratricopeptide (TPR) repeat protein
MSDKRGPRSDPEIGRKDELLAPGQNIENDHFNRHYNKELRVSKDEIPIVLAELNESSVAFIKKEQFERALNLLQKAYGIMDAIDFTGCRRDQYHLFIMFHNMALCYQKMQMLEECAQCIEHALEHMPLTLINLEEKSISYRMRKLFLIGQLKLQYCASLSQIHRHKDALEQAHEGVKVCHQMMNDMHQLALFYCKREKINKSFKENESQPQERAFDEYASRFEKGQRNPSNNSRNRSFSSYLSQ